jgi:hypothetical protein
MGALLGGNPLRRPEIRAGEVHDRRQGRARDLIGDVKDIGYFSLAMSNMSSNQDVIEAERAAPA